MAGVTETALEKERLSAGLRSQISGSLPEPRDCHPASGAGPLPSGLDVTELFFFQAEDGIRATSVTVVQTCALPISGPRASPPRRARPGSPRPRGAARARA